MSGMRYSIKVFLWQRRHCSVLCAYKRRNVYSLSMCFVRGLAFQDTRDKGTGERIVSLGDARNYSDRDKKEIIDNLYQPIDEAEAEEIMET